MPTGSLIVVAQASRLWSLLIDEDPTVWTEPTTFAPGTPLPELLQRNLAALARCAPRAAEQIAKAEARSDAQWIDTPDGVPALLLSEVIMTGPNAGAVVTRAMCSKRQPLEEAKTLTHSISVAEHPVIVVNGFGAGYHVAELCRRMEQAGVIVVFEPDVGLLRAALERLDCTHWITRSNLVILTDSSDEGAISEAVKGLDPMLAMGVHLLDHPPSIARLGPQRAAFVDAFTAILRAVKMNVITTMVQTDTTLRNLTQNLDIYALGRGVGELHQSCAGRPAILVAAGPSLQRNVHLLSQPGVRDRFVIIAVQTVLKTLLARGIKPHFVTALDYHEISRRFYEGLTAADVEGITLVVEPKVNPVVPQSWPGGPASIRCVGDSFLDELLGAELTREMGTITPGATVAHLSYYLARYLGCDPVILIGQDLGFTDGQYYADRAAIHDVWASELSEFTTLEMREWERIARMRGMLHEVEDQLGRPVYTDDQMHTYLVQFQRAFMLDERQGRTTIDATEGGVRKEHTQISTLASALSQFGMRDDPATPTIGDRLAAATSPDAGAGAPTRTRVIARVRALRRDVWQIARDSRRTATLLEDMRTNHDDQPRVNHLITQVDRVRDQVLALQPAFSLVERLNQTGGFRRSREDRQINIESTLDPLAKQRAQIQRDIHNVQWLADAADALGEMFDGAIAALEGKAKRTRDPVVNEDTLARRTSSGGSNDSRPPRVWAMISLRPFSGLGLDGPADWDGHPLLALTLARLNACRKLAGIAVLTDNPDAARRAAGPLGASSRVCFVQSAGWRGAPASALKAARAFASDTWRGGLGGWTIFDEAFDAPSMHEGAIALDAEGVLIAGQDWALIDPSLCDQLVDRFSESPKANRLTFSQAACGLGACVLGTSLVADLVKARDKGGVHASIGGLLSYLPVMPTMDPIAKPGCLGVSPMVRDAVIRCVPDSKARQSVLSAALRDARLNTSDATALEIATALQQWSHAHTMPGPGHVSVTLNEHTDIESLADAFAHAAALRSDTTLTINAGLMPMTLVTEAVRAATSAGIAALHVRIDLDRPPDDAAALLALPIHTLSVDMHAMDAETFTRLTGRSAEGFTRARQNLEFIAQRRPGMGPDLRPVGWAVATPWLVPRMTRRDEVYSQVESFYDRWTLACGHVVLDPLPIAIDGARIAPLSTPALRQTRDAIGVVHIAGSTVSCQGCIIGDLLHTGLGELWNHYSQKRAAAAAPPRSPAKSAPIITEPAHAQEHSAA